LIQNLSRNFKLRFGDLKLRDHDKFKSWSKEDYDALKTWYRNRFRGFVKPKGSFKIPDVKYPNEVLMNILGGDIVEKDRAYIAHLLETIMPTPL
jgi:hypothetical protein